MNPNLGLPDGIRGGDEISPATPVRRSLAEENQLRLKNLTHQQLMDELVSISAAIYAIELLLSHIESVSENEQAHILANAPLYQRLAEDQQVSVARIQRRYHPWDMMQHLLRPRRELLRHQYRECREEFDHRRHDSARRVAQQGNSQRQQGSARSRDGLFNTRIPSTPPPPYYP